MGEVAPRCGEPAHTTVEFTLPEWLDEFTRIAEDQRRGRIGVCAKHEGLLNVIDPGGSVFSAGVRVSATEMRGDLPIPVSHRDHRSHVRGCLGCDLDYGPQV